MKCHDFQANVVELLRGELEEARRREALAHAVACERCGELLENERRLSAALQAVAAGQADQAAPPRIEQELVAAFHSEVARTARDGGPRLEIRNPQSAIRNPRRWLWALAAASVVLFAVMVYVLLHKPARPAVNPAKTVPRQEEPATMEAKKPAVKPGEPAAAGAKLAASARKPSKAAAPRLRRTPAAPVEAELVTDFFAIPYAEPLRPEESKRIVRVRAPRSAFAALGLEINEARALEPIDADVLLGDDNLARAVRFVGTWRPAMQPARSQTVRPAPVNARFVR